MTNMLYAGQPVLRFEDDRLLRGKGAYVATGTTVTKNVPDDALAVGRARQSNKEGYASRLRASFQAKKKRAAEAAEKD